MQPSPYGQSPYQQHDNPYQPPGGFGAAGSMGFTPRQFIYKALGWKTTLTSLAVAISAVGGVMSLVLVSFMNPAALQPNLALALMAGCAVIGLGLIALAAIVLYLIWIYSAAENVRSLGNEMLQISPGWCVGWWFIPFAHLVMPFKAMSEIWRASDPEARKESTTEWTLRAGSGVIAAWWATYLASSVFAVLNFFVRDHASMAVTPLAVLSVLAKAVAGVFLIIAMRDVDRRQQEQAMMLGLG